MNAGVVFLVGAIGLTGCTTMEHHRSGDWDSSFSNYPERKSKHPPSKKENILSDLANSHKRSNQTHDPAREYRKSLLDKLERSVQKNLPDENLPIKILYAVGVNKRGERIYVLKSGNITSEEALDIPHCGASLEELYEYKEPFQSGPCYCQFRDASEGYEPHMHCHL